MSEDIKWLIGAVIGFVGLVLALIARDRQTWSGMKNVADEAGKETDRLHERVNRVRDEYVRRDDLDKHLDRLSAQMKEIREESTKSSEAISGKLDALTMAMVNRNKGDS